MTDSKIPAAQNIIQDPPEYAAAPGQTALQKAPKGSLSGGAEAPASNDPKDERDGREGTGNVSGVASKDEERAPGEGARNPPTGE